MKIIAGLVGGLLLAFLGGIIMPLTFEVLPDESGRWGLISFFLLWCAGLTGAILSKEVKLYMRRLSYLIIATCALLPLASIVYRHGYIDAGSQVDIGSSREIIIDAGRLSEEVGVIGIGLAVTFFVLFKVASWFTRDSGNE